MTEEKPGLPTGWYAGPDGVHRYWDGSEWTQTVTAVAAPDDVAASAPAPKKAPRRVLIAIVIAVIAVLVIGGGIAGLVVAENDRVAQAQAAADLEAEQDAEAEAVRRQNVADTAERAARAELVTAVEASIQADAQKRVDEGDLDGPILSTQCTALGGGSTDDLSELTGTLECIAVNEELEGGQQSGYAFSATVSWDTGRYQWHLGR